MSPRPVTKFRIDAAAARSEFGLACQRLLPWPGQGEEPPFGVMACFLPPSSSSEPDRHDQDEVMLVLSGSGAVDVAGEREPITTGDVLCIPRNREHVVDSDAGESLVWVSFYWPLHEPRREAATA